MHLYIYQVNSSQFIDFFLPHKIRKDSVIHTIDITYVVDIVTLTFLY